MFVLMLAKLTFGGRLFALFSLFTRSCFLMMYLMRFLRMPSKTVTHSQLMKSRKHAAHASLNWRKASWYS